MLFLPIFYDSFMKRFMERATVYVTMETRIVTALRGMTQVYFLSMRRWILYVISSCILSRFALRGDITIKFKLDRKFKIDDT